MLHVINKLFFFINLVEKKTKKNLNYLFIYYLIKPERKSDINLRKLILKRKLIL